MDFGVLEALELATALAEPVVSAISSITSSNPAPTSNSDADPTEPAPLTPDAPIDTPLPVAPSRMEYASAQKTNRAEPSAPAIVGRQAIAYDPRVRVPAPSFLGHGPTTVLPFSIPIGSLAVPEGDTWTTSLNLTKSIKALEQLAQLITPWRFAKLKTLDAVFLPTYYIAQMDVQIDAAWSTDSAPAFSDVAAISAHLGHTRVVFAGGVTQSTNSIIPAPLGQLNPVVRDSANYIDTPRLNCIVTGNKHDKQHDSVTILDVVVRGIVEVGDVSLY